MGQSSTVEVTDKTATIERDIARTREDMERTVNAIEERLSPAHIKEQVAGIKQDVLDQYQDVKLRVKADVQHEIEAVKQNVREATVGKVEHIMERANDRVRSTGNAALETVKTNPIPVAMIGIGLGWLLLGRSSGQRSYRRNFDVDYGYRHDDAYVPTVDRNVGAVESRVDKAKEVIKNVEGKAADLSHEAREAGRRVADRTREHAAHMREHAAHARDIGRQRLYQAEHTVSDFASENPLAVGAIAFAVGAAAGLVLPRTRTEDQLLGQARDALVDRLEGTAKETLGSVEEKARNVLGPEDKDTLTGMGTPRYG